MAAKLAYYKKAVITAVGFALSLAVAISGLGIVNPNGQLGHYIAAVIAIGTVVTMAAARNAPKYANNGSFAPRDGAPPVR